MVQMSVAWLCHDKHHLVTVFALSVFVVVFVFELVKWMRCFVINVSEGTMHGIDSYAFKRAEEA